MRIAITAGDDSGANAGFEQRFGRATGFAILDTEKNEYIYQPNMQNLNAPQGAGIQAAQLVSAHDVGAVITGHCGPKAFKVLTSAEVKVYLSDAGYVGEAVEQFQAGNLKEIENADVEGHW